MSDQPEAVRDRQSHRFWIEHVRLGVRVSAAVIAVIAAYLAMTPDLPNRGPMWVVLGVATVVTAAIWLLPWSRIVDSGHVLPIMVTWSLSLVPLIVLLAALDGGSHSPMALLLVLPMMFAALAYPVPAAVGVAVAMIIGQLVIGVSGLSGVDPRPGGLLVEGAILLMVGIMGVRIARNHGHNLERLRELAERLTRLARVDALTGCLNYRGFRDRLETEIARARRTGRPVALLHADLDHFKQVNDGLGHPVGDQVLGNIGEVLEGIARRADVVARIGGEEFAVLLPETTLADAERIAERVRVTVRGLDEPAQVTVSVGVSALPEVADTAQQLVSTADRALYAAKGSGRDRVAVAPNIREQLHRHVRGLGRAAVDRLLNSQEELKPAFQPIVAVRSGAVRGYEALTRMEGSEDSPDRWLAAAHRDGLGAELEAAMWDAALAVYRDAEWARGHPLFLNVSPEMLLTEALSARLAELPPGTVLELSEGQLTSSGPALIEALRSWTDAGLRLAVDDVGAGYEDLRAVLDLQPHFLKLDRSLIAGIDHRSNRRALVSALAVFAAQTGSTVIAEGVERPEELMTLAELRIPLAQGYGLARPHNPPRAVTWQPPVSVGAAAGGDGADRG